MDGIECLLDTNAVIRVIARDPVVLSRIPPLRLLGLPLVVYGELLLGARRSMKVTENLNRIDEILRHASVLPCDEETAKQYALVKLGLLAIGKPIPDNDMWIAAQAMQWDLPLVTRDAHFHYVHGLRVESA